MMRAFIMIRTRGAGSLEQQRAVEVHDDPALHRPDQHAEAEGPAVDLRLPQPDLRVGFTSRCGCPPAASSHASAGTPVPAPMLALRW